MNSAVKSMLSRYNPKTIEAHKYALKEIIQEIALCGLFRAGFFEKAAFYGGTALRIFHSLPRFSEDLDFSLLKKDESFSLVPFCKEIRLELAAYGFSVTVTEKEKSGETAILSAFIKSDTLTHLVNIASIKPPVSGVHSNELLKIRLEVDTNPPSGAEYEVKYLLLEPHLKLI